MKIWKNLLEPHMPDIHTFSIHLSKVDRFSYSFNLLLRIGQICILFQSPCQNLPDCHTFSIFSKFGRLALVNWAKLKKFQNLILKCLIPSEPERAAEARRAVVASLHTNACNHNVQQRCWNVVGRHVFISSIQSISSFTFPAANCCLYGTSSKVVGVTKLNAYIEVVVSEAAAPRRQQGK